MVKVKICGLSRPCDIEAVNEVKPEYIGFVFAESRRKVTPQQALELRKMLEPDIIPVGVFVDEKAENIVSLMQNGIIDAVQLHGSENEKYIEKLKVLIKKPIIKAIAVQNEGDVQKWAATSADYLLLDNKGGGAGLSFNWNLIGKTDKPFFLAGGMNLENIKKAIEETNPFAVDVSSGVETDGFKDPEKIKEFIKRVREWECKSV
ncbi:phosphoribosylanthranilate isomerase [Novisyntrophococcus fermenticellae]|jgi:phosphoribosylanthranilate isomerase|uniref:phosphoribosylanthranilate isomerase n=1 Tax=Novisyntrophococcus fermenticellae TaxID=2068655 RepID=UPI001E484419|nr:phosphoribosylanthranilate isomerase [Novisyntrophococcus fermenticellae]